LDELKKLKVKAAGVSPDLPPRLKQFDEKHRLGFPLLSDPDHKTAEAYGTWGEKSMYGKKTWGIIRSVFLLDEKGKIAGAWYKISPQDTVPKVLAALEGGS
jgi:peroxiredoxin Q/BCP